MRPSGNQQITASRTGKQISPNSTSATSGLKIIASRVADMPASVSGTAFPGSQSGNITLRTTISNCKDGLRLVALFDCGNLFWRQTSVPVIQPVVVPPALPCFKVVFGFRSNAKMRGVDARRIVATMQNDFPVRDWADEKLIRVSMRSNCFFSWKKKYPVSVIILGSVPKPASFRLCKTRFKNVIRSKQCVVLQRSVSIGPRVAAPTKFSPDYFSVPALNARNVASGLIGHMASVKGNSIYHIDGGG